MYYLNTENDHLPVTYENVLILVDLQNDFFPGGSLPIPNAHAIFPLANDIQEYFDFVIASKDWHPEDHGSFVSNHKGHQVYDVVQLGGLPQILWPDHCIQNTYGSEFHPKLSTDKIKQVFYKGTDPNIDSYSTFYDNAHRKSTGLADYLHLHNTKNVYIMGLATDYCVLYSVLDAISHHFNTYVIIDGCYGLNKDPNDVINALEKMEQSGARIITSSMIKKGAPLK